jgi:ATP-dependent DNA helicase RecQ
VLQRIWGYSEFRPPQGAIVQALLNQQDALILLPTGGGKSICFQLPAVMQPGLMLVVSPLVALMENQVAELQQRQIPAAALHRELTSLRYKQTVANLAKLRLLYLSPETLLSSTVWAALQQPTLKITGLVVDEAHCLAQWGETFRPAYYRLGAVRRSLLASRPAGSHFPVAAFTATADPTAQQTIQRILQLEQPQVFCQTPYRPNLHLQVSTVWTVRQRQQKLLHQIRAQGDQSGLVYVRTRRDSEELAAWLQARGLATAAYHAGLDPRDRRQIEQAWLDNHLQCVVSTNAFGMGVNKPDVRWVAHFQPPTLLSEYVQEVGRAGRDGNPAIATMLISEPTGWLDPSDQQRRQFFQQQAETQRRNAHSILRQLPQQGDLRTTPADSQTAIALSLLHGAGQLNWLDPFRYQRQPNTPQRDLGQLNQQAAQRMTRYLTSKTCRWSFLLAGFGFNPEANWRCGHCDRCC